MSATATGERPEYGYDSNLWLASELVNNAPDEHLATALKALLAEAYRAGSESFLSTELVRETIVQVVANGAPVVHTSIGLTPDTAAPTTYTPDAPKPKTYDADSVDAMLDRYNEKKAQERFAEDAARLLDSIGLYRPEDWAPRDEDEETDA